MFTIIIKLNCLNRFWSAHSSLIRFLFALFLSSSFFSFVSIPTIMDICVRVWMCTTAYIFQLHCVYSLTHSFVRSVGLRRCLWFWFGINWTTFNLSSLRSSSYYIFLPLLCAARCGGTTTTNIQYMRLACVCGSSYRESAGGRPRDQPTIHTNFSVLIWFPLLNTTFSIEFCTNGPTWPYIKPHSHFCCFFRMSVSVCTCVCVSMRLYLNRKTTIISW